MKPKEKAVVILLLLALMVTGVSYQALAQPVENQASFIPPATVELASAYQNTFRQVARDSLPVVVRIDVLSERRQSGIGSGVLVRREGDEVYVLTNEHVVGNAAEISLTLNDGREFQATVVGTDANRDLALLVFETREEIPIARLGDSDSLHVGDWAFAVGNPLGFESTVTAGIVSAVGRRSTPGSGIAGLTDYIQTDAAINQGNSGGALVNLAGEVVGINSWIASRSGGSIGLGFAIPINKAKRAIDDFISYGEVEYGWLGIAYGGPLSNSLVESLNLTDDDGAFVGSVLEDSPAQVAGILPGDVIAEIDGERIDDWSELLNIVADLSPGQASSFAVLRDSERLETRVVLARRSESAERARSFPGITVLPLTEEIREGLSLRNEYGAVVIAGVDPGSPAAAAGLRQGDIVRRIGNERVDDLAEFYDLINADSDEELPFRVAREGRELVIGIVR